jgi:benzoate/toluate 1,2-dioxygenase reductase subunit
MSQAFVPVTLLFADGVSRRLAVPGGGKLIDAANEAGLNLLTDCSNGQCGTCTAQLVSGTVDLDDYDPAVLPDETVPTARCCPACAA